MRWLCFLLVSAAAAHGTRAQSQPPQPPKTLRFDLAAVPATRDSFVFFLRGAPRGYAVWQYEIRSLEMGQEVLYTARSEFRPAEQERLRVVLNRLTGEPISSFHHIELFSAKSDTVMIEHDLEVRRGEVAGRRRVETRDGQVRIAPVSTALPAGAVWASYVLYAAAVAQIAPEESLSVPAYREFEDSVVSLTLVAGRPTTVQVPAGRFEVLPLKAGDFLLYVTRRDPRRVIKGETLDQAFSFELAGSRTPVPSRE